MFLSLAYTSLPELFAIFTVIILQRLVIKSLALVVEFISWNYCISISYNKVSICKMFPMQNFQGPMLPNQYNQSFTGMFYFRKLVIIFLLMTFYFWISYVVLLEDIPKLLAFLLVTFLFFCWFLLSIKTWLIKEISQNISKPNYAFYPLSCFLKYQMWHLRTKLSISHFSSLDRGHFSL